MPRPLHEPFNFLTTHFLLIMRELTKISAVGIGKDQRPAIMQFEIMPPPFDLREIGERVERIVSPHP